VPDLWFSLLVEGEWGVGIVWVWAQNCKCNKVILAFFMVNFVLKYGIKILFLELNRK
jgi:hypothetical protein